MYKELLFGLIGGLGLFIVGIKFMGDGLQKFAGNQIRKILSKLTNNRFMGVAVGALVTSIIQSSSATTVIVVGFVNAGLMTLMQAIGVIFGANIGTTITAQIIAFNLTGYALPIIAIGSGFYLFGKTTKQKNIGEFLFGFGILFLGLNLMTLSVKPLGSSELIKNAFVTLGQNPILGVLVGLLVTAIVQSSSVTVGLTMALAAAGLLNIYTAVPIVLGDNIGTTATAWLASLNTNIYAKRAAASHTLFNVLGTIVALIFLPLYMKLVLMTSGDTIRQIANFHSMFNIINTILFIGFVPLFAKTVTWLIRGKEPFMSYGTSCLEKKLLATPSIAIESAKKEIVHMAKIVRKMLKDTKDAFMYNDKKYLADVDSEEKAVDQLQAEITDYLVMITQQELSEEESSKIPALLHAVNDIERVGDHCMTLMELAERKIDNKLKFSKFAMNEIRSMYDDLDEMIKNVITALSADNKKAAYKVLDIEDRMNKKTNRYRENHLNRLKKGVCLHLSGVVFMDYIMNLERMADHATNVAQAVLGKLSWNNNKDHHGYEKSAKITSSRKKR